MTEIDELRRDASLPEEAECSAGRLRVCGPEHLDDDVGGAEAGGLDGHAGSLAAGSLGYHRPVRGSGDVTIWFTVQLEDRPGSLARVAQALAERSVNVTGIVGVAEDADGAIMLTTSDAAGTRAAFEALGLPFEEHDEGLGTTVEGMTVGDLRADMLGR